MAATGKLEKMLILAFDTAEDAERGGDARGEGALRGPDQPRELHARVQGQDGRRPGAGHQRSADQVRVHAPRGADLRLPVRQHRPDRRQAEAGRRLRRGRRVPQAAHRVPGRLARAVPPQARLGEPDLQGPSDRGRHHLQAVQPRRPADPGGRPGQVQGLDRGEEARRRRGSPARPTSPTGGPSGPATPCRSCASRSTAIRGTTCSSPTSTGSTTSAGSPSAAPILFPPLPPQAARR